MTDETGISEQWWMLLMAELWLALAWHPEVVNVEVGGVCTEFMWENELVEAEEEEEVEDMVEVEAAVEVALLMPVETVLENGYADTEVTRRWELPDLTSHTGSPSSSSIG